jgi:predicted nucleotidyltransferase
MRPDCGGNGRFFGMDKTVVEKVRKYAELVKNFIDAKEIILYGSFARGDEREDSDIDVAVVVDEVEGDYIRISAGLFDLTRQIDPRIEPVLISLKHDRSGFLKSVIKNGRIVYRSG